MEPAVASRIRIFFRVIVLGILVGVVLLTALLFTPYPARLLRGRILAQIAEATGGQVTIGSIEIRPFPLRIILTDVHLVHKNGAGDELEAACRKADLVLPYGVYRGRLDRIDAMDLESPEVTFRRGTLATTPQGGAAGEKPTSLLPVRIGRLGVTDGSLLYADPAAGRSFALGSLSFQATSTGLFQHSLQGRFEQSSLSIRMGDETISGVASSAFQISAHRLGFTEMAVQAPGEYDASGSMSLDFSKPATRVELAARGRLEAAEKPRPLLGDLNGDLEVAAAGASDEKGLSLGGAFKSSEIHYAGLDAGQITGKAEIASGRLALSDVQGRTLDGSASGDCVVQWDPDKPEQSDLKARLSLEGSSSRQLLKLFKLEEIPISGRVRHRGEYHLRNRDMNTLEASGQVVLEGSLDDFHPEPLKGSARFKVSGHTLTLKQAQASTRTLKAAYEGTVPLDAAGTGKGKFFLTTGDLTHVYSLLGGLPDQARGPISEMLTSSRDARLALEGDVAWKAGLAWLDGKVQAGPLTLRGASLGELDADLLASPRSLELRSLVLSGGAVTLNVSGSAQEGTFHLAGEAGHVPIEWIQEWLSLSYPVAGQATARLDLSGPVERPEGSVDFTVEEPRLYGIPFNSAQGRLVLSEQAMSVESLTLSREDGAIALHGTIGLRGGPLDLQAEGKDLNLSWLHDAGLIPGEVAGPVSATARLTGTFQAPQLEAEASTTSINVKGIETGAIKAKFSADRTEGSLVVVPEMKGMNFAGRILWDERSSFDGDLILEQFQVPITSWGAALPVTDVDLTLTGGIRVEGALRGPARFAAYGNLVHVALRLGQLTLENQVPAFFRWEGSRLELTKLRLTGTGTDLTLQGVGEPELGHYHFSTDGSVSLAALASFYPGLIAGGAGDISIKLDSTAEGTHLEGSASVHGGRLQGGGLPLPIVSLEGKVVLDAPGDFHLEGVRFIAGGGLVNVEGKGNLHGIQIASMDLALKGSYVQIAYPDGFRGRYDLDLALAQNERGGVLSGNVNLIRGVYSKDFKIERSLLSLGHEEDLAEASEEEPGLLSSTKLDLAVRADENLWIINDLAKLEGRANLHIGGTVGAPQVTGRVSAFEGSIIKFRQVEYQVTHGNIDLIDLDRFNPYFDITSEARVKDYDITLKLGGSLEHVELDLTSNPPLSQQDIVALLVTGRTLASINTPGTGQQSLEESAAGAMTGGLAAGLGSTVQTMAKLDQFSIDPVVLGHEGDPASRVTVGKQISENLYAAYSTLLGGSSEEIYELDYMVGRDFKLTSTRDSDGAVGGDLRYVWRRKTGPGSEVPDKPPPKTIRNLTVEGDPGISARKLRHLFHLKVGDKMDRAKANAGEERLLAYYHRKDRLQAQVDSREQAVEGEEGLVDVVLKADSGPQVEIQVEGTPSDRKYRKKLREGWQESVFPEEAPDEAKARLEHLLQNEGYYYVKVGVALPVNTAQERKVVLTAVPGTRVAVESIDITGNQNFSTEELRGFIHSKSGKGAYLDPDKAKVDAGRIRGKYLFDGYPGARVPPPKIVFGDDPSKATLRFEITEGDPVRIRSVTIEGNTSIPTEKLLEDLPVQSGSPFLRLKVRSGADLIRMAYDRAGFGQVQVDYEMTGPSSDDLVYKVAEGSRRYVGGIQIQGNLLTRSEVMERELTFKPGDPLSREEMLKSQRALYRLGVFQSVEFSELMVGDPDRPTILIKVGEADNLIQSVGVGYDSQEGVRALYDITNTNLFGRGRTLSLVLRGSRIDSRAQILFKDPFLFNRRVDSLITTYWTHQERESFTEEVLGATLQVSKKHTKEDRTFYRYTIKDVDVSDLQVTPEEAGVQTLRLSGPSFSYTHDSRDDFFNPHKGNFDSLDLGVASELLGSDVSFVKFYGLGSWFRKLTEQTVWAQAIRAGLAIPFSDTTDIPISERFFAGGDTTVRGFGRDEVGPKDPVTGKPLGGQTLFIVNEEIRYPIWRMLRGVVFVDAGSVQSTIPEFFPLKPRWAAGLGVRIDTPIGPFRLEYGWKLNREPGEAPGELNFSIGQAF